MGDPEAAKYVDGIGFHWYLDFDMEVNWYHYVSDAHKTYPKLLLLPTEACEGYLPWSMVK